MEHQYFLLVLVPEELSHAVKASAVDDVGVARFFQCVLGDRRPRAAVAIDNDWLGFVLGVRPDLSGNGVVGNADGSFDMATGKFAGRAGVDQ